MNNTITGAVCRLIFAVTFIVVSEGVQAQLDPGNKIVVINKEEIKPALQKGVTAYQKESYPMALEIFGPLAANGDDVAQFYLGRMYMQGLGVKANYNKALFLIRKAAQHEVAEAQNLLGFFYYYGLGVKQDYKEAALWIGKSADQGIAEAQNNLGWLYENGQGVVQDRKQAYMWYKIAGASGEGSGVLRMKALEYYFSSAQIEEVDALPKNGLQNRGDPACRVVVDHGGEIFDFPA